VGGNRSGAAGIKKEEGRRQCTKSKDLATKKSCAPTSHLSSFLEKKGGGDVLQGGVIGRKEETRRWVKKKQCYHRGQTPKKWISTLTPAVGGCECMGSREGGALNNDRSNRRGQGKVTGRRWGGRSKDKKKNRHMRC